MSRRRQFVCSLEKLDSKCVPAPLGLVGGLLTALDPALAPGLGATVASLAPAVAQLPTTVVELGNTVTSLAPVVAQLPTTVTTLGATVASL
jgi:hypothetical protein